MTLRLLFRLGRRRARVRILAKAARTRRLMSRQINHVSVSARHLQESVDFYVDLIGAQPIPTPNFGIPVQWLAVGRTQLHLFERDVERRAIITLA